MRTGKMGRGIRAKSFVTIMIVIAICALFLRIAIERIIKYNIAQNESVALSTLKLISAALENYAKDHHGVYPASLAVLTKTKPAYLDRDYTNSPFKGYNYNCLRLEASGYSCNASPVRCKLSGRAIYTVSTGSPLVSDSCEKKE
jgi:competence protein ComGC